MGARLTATVLVLASLAALPARAEWRSVSQVTQGTAQTLEQGTFSIGIVSPLVAGLTNRLTVQTHPILDLLLVPSLGLRYRIAETPRAVVAATASFKRSFGVRPASAQAEALAPGELVGGGLLSLFPSSEVALTGGLYHASHFDEPINGRTVAFAQGIAASAQVHWLPRPDHLLQLSAYLRYGFAAAGLERPVVTAAWTHATRRWLGGAHVLVVVSVFDKVPGLPSQLSWLNELPVMPTVDLWWRL